VYCFLRYTIIPISAGQLSQYADYGLDDERVGIRFTAEAKIFPFTTVSRPALGSTHPASYPEGSENSFPGGKQTVTLG
jgi:hypothetical protein